MSEIEAAVYFTPEMIDELRGLKTGWPLSNEACWERARQIRPGWHWASGAWLAGSRRIVAFEPFAEPGRRISIPWREEFDRWFKSG